MGFKYALIHISIHLFIVFTIYFIFNLNLQDLITVLFSSFIIDLDHLPLLIKHGIFGTFFLRTILEFKKPRKYPLHNFLTFLLSGFFSVLIFSRFFILGVYSLSIFLHLIWDFFEDVIIFRMGINHWKV